MRLHLIAKTRKVPHRLHKEPLHSFFSYRQKVGNDTMRLWLTQLNPFSINLFIFVFSKNKTKQKQRMSKISFLESETLIALPSFLIIILTKLSLIKLWLESWHKWTKRHLTDDFSNYVFVRHIIERSHLARLWVALIGCLVFLFLIKQASSPKPKTHRRRSGLAHHVTGLKCRP